MALTGSTNEQKAWNFLKAQGLSDCGAAGLLGNLYAESGLIPTNLQNTAEKRLGLSDDAYTRAVDDGTYTNFAGDSAGYGLAQWTFRTRKQGLLDYCKAQGRSVGDLEAQLGFLMLEMKTEFQAVLSTLKTAQAIREASDVVLKEFEGAANQTEASCEKRAAYGQTYLDRFAGGGQGAAGSASAAAEQRNLVVSIARGFIGCKESDGSHRQIIDLYNAHKPLARGYRVKYTDAWCSTFASAVAIKAGLTDIIPTECGCEPHIQLFRQMGRWQENDAYRPSPGDYIFYDWGDSGAGDDTGRADHVGIVEKVSGSTITVIEGNNGNAVRRRAIAINARYIRGYGVPAYGSTVSPPTPQKAPSAPANGQDGDSTNTTPGKTPYDAASRFSAAYARQYTVTARAGLHIRKGAGTGKAILGTLRNGTKVRCYGYFNTDSSGTPWLLAVAGDITGYVCKTYLK